LKDGSQISAETRSIDKGNMSGHSKWWYKVAAQKIINGDREQANILANKCIKQKELKK
jgi:hypothetical protein